jgi:hypothetical protein
LFIKAKVFVVNWFQWHPKLQHLFRGALYNKRKCKKRALPLSTSEKGITNSKSLGWQVKPIELLKTLNFIFPNFSFQFWNSLFSYPYQ